MDLNSQKQSYLPPRSIIYLLIIYLGFSSSPSYAQYEHVLPLENYDLNTFEDRAQLIVESIADYGVNNGVWTSEKNGAYPAIALFTTGNIELGRHFAREQLTGSGAMFREFGNMILYMKCGHLYDQELKDMVKDDQLNHSVLYSATESGNLPGASENHKLMYAAANYLGGLAWPEDYPDLWFKAGYNHLMNWFDKVTSTAYWEEDSPTYFVHHIGPILSVMEFAPDTSEMKKRATMVLEWYMAGVAAEYLKGYWISPSARDYVPVNGLHLSEESIATLWLYFGDTGNRIPHPHPTSGHEAFRHWYCAVHMATSDYRLPEALVNIAKDRDKPYSFKEYLSKNPMKPSEYGFINKYYGLTAMVDESGNPPPDMTRWKLQWVPDEAEMEPSVFFMKHPMPNEDDGWKNWEGASPYEQVYQHEKTLIAMYDIPLSDAHPFIDGPLDSAVYRNIMQKNDWWFFHAGELLFAVYADKGLYLTDEMRIAYDHFGTTALTGILRSDGNENFLIVETALREDYSGGSAQDELNLFADSFFDNTLLEISSNGSAPVVEFRNLDGDWIKMEYEGERRLNKSIVSFTDWPMIENPWMSQQRDGRFLTIRHGEQNLLYDFQKWERCREEENINLMLNIPPADTILVNPEFVKMEALPDKDTSIIEKVEFYINDDLIASDSLSPFIFDWMNPEPGIYEIDAKLLTNDNTYTFSNKHHLIISDGTPEINLIFPQSGKFFLLQDTLEIQTEAIDYDGVVDSVHFYVNDSLMGKDITEPFNCLWIKPEEGSFKIHAIAWDNDQNSDTTSVVSIHIVGYNESSDIGKVKNGIIYSYFEGNWFQLPDFENLNAVETDTIFNFRTNKRKRDFEFAFSFYGYIKIAEKGKYTFYTHSDLESKLFINDHLLVQNTGGTQQSNAVLLYKGFHRIKLEMVNKMKDQDVNIWYEGPGTDKQAIPDSVLFRAFGNQPEIKIGSPPADTIYNKGDKVHFQFEIKDVDNDDYKIILFEGDKQINELQKFNYTTAIDSLAGELHAFKAVVYDLEGATAESEVFTVLVNLPPVLEFESPVLNEEFYTYDTVRVMLTTTDKDIREVHFYLNEKLNRTVYGEPWYVEFQNLKQGNYFLKAISKDSLGLESLISTSFKIINSAPEIAILKPLHGTVFPLGEQIVLQAQLTDYDDDVYKVAFYENDNQVGQNANILYQTTVYNFSEGEHLLTAKAFDLNGSVSVSDPVAFRVLDMTGIEYLSDESRIIIYPVPLKEGLLTVETSLLQTENSGMKVRLSDITGRIHYIENWERIPESFTIPSGIFKGSGVYFLSFQFNDKVLIKKVLVE